MNNLGVVIPAREKSTRINNKVMLPFFENLNLLEWKINQISSVFNKEQIIVSSNSQNLKNIALNMGVSYAERDSYLCEGHKASFSEVITGVVKDIDFEHIAWCTVVVPLMSPSEYLSAFKKYKEVVVNKKEKDSLVTVNLIKEYFWDNKGPLNYTADKNHTISQNLPNWYKITNALYMMKKTEIIKRKYFLGLNPYLFEVPKISGVDIDEYEDYQLALAYKNKYYEDLNTKNIER
jgi:N-acylneuraminate cytidylyltransferase